MLPVTIIKTIIKKNLLNERVKHITQSNHITPINVQGLT